MPPGFPGGRGGFGPGGPGGASQPERDHSTIDTSVYDEFVILVVRIVDKTDTFSEMKITPYAQQMRGKMDMDSKKFRLGDLAASYAIFRESRQDVLPPGAHNRKRDPSRGRRDWPAGERVSWLCELLPYFGEDRWVDLYGSIQRERSWRDADNQKAGRILVPQFLNPNADFRLGVSRRHIRFMVERPRWAGNPPVADHGQIQLDCFGRINGAGWHWAGERDVFESIAAVKKRFNIDEKRIILRGFSQGGEGAWHISLHHPDRFAAAGCNDNLFMSNINSNFFIILYQLSTIAFITGAVAIF
jgi:hypothetical protein